MRANTTALAEIIPLLTEEAAFQGWVIIWFRRISLWTRLYMRLYVWKAVSVLAAV